LAEDGSAVAEKPGDEAQGYLPDGGCVLDHPDARKGKSGRVLLRRQRDYPAATVADFSTAVLTEAQRPAIEIVEAQQSDLAGAQAMAIGDQK
jgi:hypothetical protein